MARTNQSQKQRKAQADAVKKSYAPEDNIVRQPVHTLEDLIAIYPLKAHSKYITESVISRWSKFDFSLVDKFIFAQGWSNYDQSGFLCVFTAIDGSIQYCYCEDDPFKVYCEENEVPTLNEATPAQAKREIDSLIATQDSIENYYNTEGDF